MLRTQRMSSMIQSAGFLTQHMAIHLAMMGLVAPIVATLALRRNADLFPPRLHLAAATAAQVALLWAWHAPSVLTGTHESGVAAVAMHLSLFLCSLWFWAAIFRETERAPWKSVVALLVTGKLFCLLGILFTFAPRPLYAAISAHAGHLDAAAAMMIRDQQLAGLVMLAACPAVYVAASTLIARRWLSRIDRSGGWSLPVVRRQE